MRESIFVTSQQIARTPERRHRLDKTVKMWSKLHTQMTLSYVIVSVVSALLVELLLVLIVFLVILRLPIIDQATMETVDGAAQYTRSKSPGRPTGTR